MDPTHIIRAVAARRGVSVDDLIGPEKVACFTVPRHEAFALIREITRLSFARIGELMGGRDPSTVQSGIDSCLRRIDRDPSYAAEFDTIRHYVQDAVAHCDLPPRLPALMVARGAIGRADCPPQDAEQMALMLLLVRATLGNADLTDNEARRACLYLLGEAHA